MKEIVCIGGSAGSLPMVMRIVEAVPANFSFTVVIVVHRLRNVASDMEYILSSGKRNLLIREPEDKEAVRKGRIYLAPQNYHLQIEEDKTFSLDYSEAVNFSRPSIDVTFDCVASVYKDKATGILLSGANTDGAHGLSRILAKGGTGIVQEPGTAEYPAMPNAAISGNEDILVYSPKQITHYMATLNQV